MGNEHYKNLSLTDIKGEVWRDIEDFTGFYMVSNMGRVKSLERWVWNGWGYRYVPNSIRKQTKFNHDKKCYRTVIRLKKGKFIINKTTSFFVATAFIDNPNNYPIAFHKSKNFLDNRIENLYWGDSGTHGDIISDNYKAKENVNSKYKGVHKYKNVTYWYQMLIRINGKAFSKTFKTELEAAKKYDYYVKKYKLNRELNFPDEK